MRPIYFGGPSRQLYGVIQEPASSHFADYAVLMCYPFGQEYMRSHRAFRQLGNLFARNGVASLRFDYHGTGDSMGDSSEFSFQESVKNCQLAFEELQRVTAADRIHVVGLRLGAMIAAAALGTKADVRGFVFWDSIISGASYINELRSTITDEQVEQLIVNDTWWVSGFPLYSSVRDEIQALAFENIQLAKNRDVLQIVSRSDVAYDTIAQNLQKQGNRVTHEYMPLIGDDDWQRVDDQGSLLLPHQQLNAIVNHVIKV